MITARNSCIYLSLILFCVGSYVAFLALFTFVSPLCFGLLFAASAVLFLVGERLDYRLGQHAAAELEEHYRSVPRDPFDEITEQASCHDWC